MKIGHKLVLITVLIAMFAVAIDMSISYHFAKEAIVNRVKAQLESVVVIKEDQLNTFITSIVGQLQRLAREDWSIASAKELFSTTKSTSDISIDHILQEHLTGSNFTELFIIDLQGKILFSTDTTHVGNIVSGEDYFNKSKEGDSYLENFYYDSITLKPSSTLATPFVDASGKEFAILAGRINLKSISDLMTERAGLGDSGETYLVNKYNLAVTTLRKNEGTEFQKYVYSAGITDCLKKHDGFHDTSYAGSSVIGLHRWIPRNSVCLIASIDYDEAMKPAYAIAYNSLPIGFGILIFVTISGLLITRSISRPIRRLTNAALVISQGNLDTKIDIDTKDEIGTLGQAFNEMAENLRNARSGLEQRIQEKTAQLSEQIIEVESSKKAILNLLEDIEGEKKKVEEIVVIRTRELSNEKARLLASINSLPFGFIIADTDDKVLVRNEALLNILELAEEPASIADIVDSFKGVTSNLDALAHSCRECLEIKRMVELKEISHGKKYLRVFCTPILTKDDTAQSAEVAIGYVILVEDITEAKVMERSRDEFFAVASHELRTPLTAIRGNADMILDMYADKIVDKDMKEMLTDIGTSSVRLISIVNDFLEASRLEQGRVEIKKEKFDIAEVVAKVDRDLREMISKKGLALVYVPPTAPLPAVNADKDKVEQILVNLIGNAAKFTKEGSITVALTAAENFIQVRVTDTGAGISEHNQALLFRKFQQAGEQMLARDVTQSTGLGLYISRLIISSMGGTIGLEKSELGKGSTFVFTVPIAS